MTPKQEAFVREYLIDLDAAKAVARAGYHATGQRAAEIGYQLLQKTPVQAKIQAAMSERAKRTEISSDYVLTTIRDTVERCRQAVPVYEKQDGELVPTGEFEFDSQAVLRGCELLGKHLRLFTDKTEVSGSVTVQATSMDEKI